MAETTLVRPYAKAVFEMAEEASSLAAWSTTLETLSEVVTQPSVQLLIGSPAVGQAQVAEAVIDCCGGLDAAASNLVRLLSENDKLSLATELRVQFEVLRAEAERVVDVEVTSAIALSDKQLTKIVDGVKARLGREVRVTTAVDAVLLGGAIVRAGDLVIDGSVRTKLESLNSTLLN